MKRAEGFTLMEVIIAVAIVAVMAGALVPVVFHQINAARRDATDREIDDIRDALLAFYEDTGRFPTEAEGLGALVADPGVAGWRGPYLDSGPADPLEDLVRDAFGEQYTYDLGPQVIPASSADVIVASPGVNRVRDMPDQGSTWVLAHIADHDDLIRFISSRPLNRDKEDETVAELEELIAAASSYYLDLGTFPSALTDLQAGYIDAGFRNDAFTDGWRNGYLSRIDGTSSPVLWIWSAGPNQRDDGGSGDDLAVSVSAQVLDNR